ncbi:MAG: hypothetical protein HY231_17530 [Acidobacteria bacterium]|nr:hypothetical protein [Acidobacteriota bacterium]
MNRMIRIFLIYIVVFALTALTNISSIAWSQVQTNNKEHGIAGHSILATYLVSTYMKQGIYLDEVRTILEDRRGLIWMGSIIGLYCYDPFREEWRVYNDALGPRSLRWIKNITEDAQGRIWAQDGLRGWAYFDGTAWHKAKELFPPSIKKEPLFCFSASNDILWFGSSDGLIKYDGVKWTKPFLPPSEIERDNPHNKEKDRHSTAYPNKFDSEDEKNPLNEGWCGHQDRDGLIWIGTKKSLLTFHPYTKKWEVISLPGNLEGVWHIYEDRQARLWFADSRGNMTVYDKRVKRWSSYNLTTYFPKLDLAIEGIYQDKTGRMMIATSEGLVLFDAAQGSWELLTAYNTNRLLGYNVNCVTEDKRGRIWVVGEEAVIVLSNELRIR